MNWVVFIFSACVEQQNPELKLYVDWKRGNIETTPNGWAVLTDRDTEVQVTDGTLINHTVQLLPCQAKSDFGIVRSAFAGHGFPVKSTDSSAVVYSIQESLLELKHTEIHKQNFKKSAYCSAHNLVAKYRSVPKTRMEGLSLWLEGRWRKNSEKWVEFSLKTGLSNGKSLSIQVDDSQSADIVFVRDPSTLFDGIDFVDAKKKQIERKVLSNLMQDLTVEVRK